MAHEHNMTPEYDEDMGFLASAVTELRQTDPKSPAAAAIEGRLAAICKAACAASAAIAAFREAAQSQGDANAPSDAELGAWAGGLGRVPLHAGHRVCQELAAGQTAERAGASVNAFFDAIADRDRTATLLASVIDLAFDEGGDQFPDDLRAGLNKLREKIQKRSSVPLHTPCDGDSKLSVFIPPPYYWPSTYVSSSSSGQASSSTWPPP